MTASIIMNRLRKQRTYGNWELGAFPDMYAKPPEEFIIHYEEDQTKKSELNE